MAYTACSSFSISAWLGAGADVNREHARLVGSSNRMKTVLKNRVDMGLHLRTSSFFKDLQGANFVPALL
jgi:hypothetical protein